MNTTALEHFQTLITDTQTQTGIELPYTVSQYVAALLTEYCELPDFLPKTTFAEAYYTVNTARDCKQLGDSCLFVTGVFPKYGQKYGIDRRYYQAIGRAAYDRLEADVFQTLSYQFKFVSNFIDTVINGTRIDLTRWF